MSVVLLMGSLHWWRLASHPSLLDKNMNDEGMIGKSLASEIQIAFEHGLGVSCEWFVLSALGVCFWVVVGFAVGG
jgi:hypothetical protein